MVILRENTKPKSVIRPLKVPFVSKGKFLEQSND